MVASWSKDPSTQCGAVIVNSKNRIVSVGYNGFPAMVADTQERLNNREQKYKYILHAEQNAILNTNQDLEGCTMYVTHPCCSRCVVEIAAKGIRRVVWQKPTKEFLDRWHDEDLTEIIAECNISTLEL